MSQRPPSAAQPFIRRIELDRPAVSRRTTPAVHSRLTRLATAVGAVLVAIASALSAQASSLPAAPWAAERAAIEDCLERGVVTERSKISVGITKPEKVTLDCGDRTIGAIWKALQPGYQHGWWEDYRSEVAAYRIDVLLGLDMVPPTVARLLGPRRGSLQLWVEGFSMFGDDPDSTRIPQELWDRIKVFDFLMSNPDRNQGNILIAQDGRVALIDHSRAAIFRGGSLSKATWTPKRCDDALRQRVSKLNRSLLQDALGDIVGKRAIKPIVLRLGRLAEVIDQQSDNEQPEFSPDSDDPAPHANR